MTTRRLAAILAADVVGYSRLMEQDEDGTLAALKARRKEVLQPLVAEHQGRVIKLMGDGALVEFASAVNAVACAVELQKRMAAANEELVEDRRIVLRIGINLGDVIVEGGDLYGEGVNVAARLQTLAEPGTIHVSAKVRDEVQRKLVVAFEDLGERELKNVATPVRVYRVRGRPFTPPTTPGPLSLPAKPSIAVLAFDNLSRDPGQDHFVDGIVEDMITALSRFRNLFVIARNSSFQYRNQAIDPKRVGRELGVRYILEGSARELGGRIRISAQLIDAATGLHVWADRFDRDLKDVFAVQDEITQHIVGSLAVRIEANDLALAKRKPPESMQAYDYWLQANTCIKRHNKEGFVEAQRYLERAIEVDPSYARAYSTLSYVHNMATSYVGWGGTPLAQLYEKAYALAERAVLLDDTDNWTHLTLGWCLLWRRRYSEATRAFERALALNANDADAMAYRGYYLTIVGRPEEGVEAVRTAMRLNPAHHPDYYLGNLMCANLMARRYEDAIAAVEGVSDVWPESPAWLACAFAHAGRLDEARARAAAFVANIRAIWVGDPNAGSKEYVEWWLSDNPFRRKEDYDLLIDGVRKAGLSV
jgi:TolB-like protein/class 3 adenylate cyclase/Tfp pilus assembly protein PilF